MESEIELMEVLFNLSPFVLRVKLSAGGLGVTLETDVQPLARNRLCNLSSLVLQLCSRDSSRINESRYARSDAVKLFISFTQNQVKQQLRTFLAARAASKVSTLGACRISHASHGEKSRQKRHYITAVSPSQREER